MFPVYSNTIIYGSTQAGKTSLLHKLIRNRDQLFPLPPQNIIYVHKDTEIEEIKNELSSLKSLNFIDLNSLPDKETLLCMTSPYQHTLLIIDDCLNLGTDPFFLELFTIYSHHQKTSIIISTQDLHRGQQWSSLLKNNHNWILMSCLQNNASLIKIGRLMGNFPLLKCIFTHVSQKPYNYLIILNHPSNTGKYQFVNSIFPEERPIKVFRPKN